MGVAEGRCFCGLPRAVASSFNGRMVDKVLSFFNAHVNYASKNYKVHARR